MRISEADIAPVRDRFGDREGNIPVGDLNALYNRTFNGHLPRFNPLVHGARAMDALSDYRAIYGMPPWGIDRFSYTHGWKPAPDAELPALQAREFVLVAAYVDRIPPLPDELEWNFHVHVCNYVMRDHVPMVATELQPRIEMREALAAICEHWRLKYCDPAVYGRQLADLGLSWAGSDPGLRPPAHGRTAPREALYPIELTADSWHRLVAEQAFPAFLGAARPGHPVPILLVLSANSD